MLILCGQSAVHAGGVAVKASRHKTSRQRSTLSSSMDIASCTILESLLNEGIGCAIHICCGFIKCKDWSILQQCPASLQIATLKMGCRRCATANSTYLTSDFGQKSVMSNQPKSTVWQQSPTSDHRGNTGFAEMYKAYVTGHQQGLYVIASKDWL